ncbi:hypothetical protein [Shewanella sp. Actino-trap-3]|uniref:hypothetical protein n=1 Tax=Shewanella sp. Actino-trap-3 TaxID=2058331 RepID=UPI0018E3F251|nr:hypothetical protein [Shewanella sp. Actino-trap-3]
MSFTFSYIMEAADDISYGIADLEDAVEKGFVSSSNESRTVQKFKEVAENFGVPERDAMDEMLKEHPIDVVKISVCFCISTS